MNILIFAVYDKKAATYLKLFTDTSAVQALRGFDQAVNEADSQLARYPDDFHLHQLGGWDQLTGKLTQDINDLGSARTVLREPVAAKKN